MPAAKPKKEFTHLEMEAALCVWECLNEWTLGNEQDVEKLRKEAAEDPHSHAAIRIEWIDMRDETGSGEMRSQSIVLGKWCLEIYDILTAHDPDFFAPWSYDWEVIPTMLKHACSKDGKASMYRGSYVYIGKPLIPAHSAAQLVAQEFAWRNYEEACQSEASKQWSFGDLVRENPEDFIRGFESGDDPKKLVKAIGEDLDLIDFGPWS